MSKKVKEITITTQFSNFRELCKKLRVFNDLMIKLPNNIIILDHNKNDDDSLPTENFAVWKDIESGMFYNWAVLDPKHFHTAMTDSNVKIKGTNVDSDNDKISIYKDGNFVYKIDKLSGDMDQRFQSALKHYRKMNQYIWNYMNYDFIEIDQSIIDKMADGRPISLDIQGKCSINLARSLFPLLKKSGTPMSYAIVENDVENSKIYILFKEEYEMFDLYTLIACIAISIPLQNENLN